MWQVIGQAKALFLLQRSLETDSLAHAYLLVGPAHVGKMTLAFNLAQALNCEATDSPCGRCLSCEKIASAKHSDVQVIGLSHGGASVEIKLRAEISIDQIRQIQHSANLPPFEGNYKIFIIDGAELLSVEAANCLLKTLEEPAARVVFILLTINERLLPMTVVSRCQRLELLPMAITELEEALNKNWGVARQKANLLARLSHGCLGWAVSVALDNSLMEQRAERLDELLEIIKADDEERFSFAARLATQFNQNRRLVQEWLDLWLDCWRDLLLIKVGLSGYINNIDRLETFIDMAESYRLTQIKTFIDSIRVAGEQFRQNANPQLVLEVLMLDIPEILRRDVEYPIARFEVKYG